MAGDLPSSWAIAELRQIAKFNPGFDASDLPDETPVHFVPMVAAMEDFRGVDTSRVRPLREVRKGYTSFATDDVLFAKITPCMENGKGGLVPALSHPVAYGSTEFHVLRAGDAVSSQWLAHFLSRVAFRQVARENMTGTAGQLRVPTTWLVSTTIPIPPKDEQTRIVAKLEELFSDLDAGVAELEAAKAKLAQYRRSLLKAAVEGALTADWRREHAGKGETGEALLQRILAERRARWEARRRAKFEQQDKVPPKGRQNAYPEPVAPDTRELPALPRGWVWASAEQLCGFITKGTTPPKDLEKDGEKVVPFLRVTNLTQTGRLDFSDRVFVSRSVHEGFLARSVVYPGDVLMNIVGPPLGQVSVVPPDFGEWNVNQAIAIFRPVSGVRHEFLVGYFTSAIAREWLKARAKTTAGQTNLTLEVCRALPIPLPGVDEQAQIVVTLDSRLADVAAGGQAVDKALRQSTAQRQNLLRAAFSGRLVPQDPNDEPASMLLERIRAARAAQGAAAKARGGKTRETA